MIFIENFIRRLIAIGNVSTYANDIKLLSCNPSKLQTALNIVDNLSMSWQLRIQSTKSEHITYSRKPATNFRNQCYINEFILQGVSFVVYLGITLTSDFKWYSYVPKISENQLTFCTFL